MTITTIDVTATTQKHKIPKDATRTAQEVFADKEEELLKILITIRQAFAGTYARDNYG